MKVENFKYCTSYHIDCNLYVDIPYVTNRYVQVCLKSNKCQGCCFKKEQCDCCIGISCIGIIYKCIKKDLLNYCSHE